MTVSTKIDLMLKGFVFGLSVGAFVLAICATKAMRRR